MLTKKLSEEAKRPGASCLKCEWLNHETTPCLLRRHILAKEYKCSNYAAEGCEKFRGDWTPKVKEIKRKKCRMGLNSKGDEMNRRIKIYLLEGNTFRRSMLSEWGISNTTLHNCLTVLKRQGHRVVSIKDDGDTLHVIQR